MKTETMQEFLERGGEIKKIPSGNECPPFSYVGANDRTHIELTHDDLKDGDSPNLKWIGDL